ncbi:hypothetical protein [Nodularia spumigena]|nr:hypothetical protein [Nodularia spumigena]
MVLKASNLLLICVLATRKPVRILAHIPLILPGVGKSAYSVAANNPKNQVRSPG